MVPHPQPNSALFTAIKKKEKGWGCPFRSWSYLWNAFIAEEALTFAVNKVKTMENILDHKYQFPVSYDVPQSYHLLCYSAVRAGSNFCREMASNKYKFYSWPAFLQLCHPKH